jgi:hypothetical protein
VTIDIAWFLFLTQGLYERAGGPLGVSTEDLAASAFEDAGIEEQKATMYALADELRRAPVAEPVRFVNPLDPGVDELRGQVAALTRAVEDLKQGLIPS